MCVLILFGQVGLSQESGETISTNKIDKVNLNPSQQNTSMEERITKRHINDKPFMAYNWEDDDRVATAEFSLNPPKPCDRSDGSAYFPPHHPKGKSYKK